MEGAHPPPIPSSDVQSAAGARSRALTTAEVGSLRASSGTAGSAQVLRGPPPGASAAGGDRAPPCSGRESVARNGPSRAFSGSENLNGWVSKAYRVPGWGASGLVLLRGGREPSGKAQAPSGKCYPGARGTVHDNGFCRLSKGQCTRAVRYRIAPCQAK